MKSMRRATSVILLRRSASGSAEVYLVERNPKLRFFGGYWAFPGGVIDAGDGEGDRRLLESAQRELFEETGVLLGVEISGEREAVRKALLDEDRTAWDAGPRVATPLEPAGDITTPPFAPIRYETSFFAATLPDGETPEIWPGELVQGRFWDPAEALTAWKRGEVSIVPPALLFLRLLAESGENFVERSQTATAELAAGRLHPVWFSPGVYMAPLATQTKPPATTTNTLVVGEETLYVIDPSPTDVAEQERLWFEIDARVSAGARVGGALLTHHHPDHVGAVAAFSERYGVPVHAHSRTLSQLTIPGATEELHDGDSIDLGRAPDGTDGWKLEVWETPGHCEGHLAFRESRYHAAIVGDLASSLSTVVIDPREGHMKTYLESVDKIRRLEIGVLYPGHGPAVKDGERFLGRLLSHRKDREDKLAAALTDTPQSVDELVAQVYDDVPKELWPLALHSMHAGLIKLEEDGRAKAIGEGWQLA